MAGGPAPDFPYRYGPESTVTWPVGLPTGPGSLSSGILARSVLDWVEL